MKRSRSSLLTSGISIPSLSGIQSIHRAEDHNSISVSSVIPRPLAVIDQLKNTVIESAKSLPSAKQPEEKVSLSKSSNPNLSSQGKVALMLSDAIDKYCEYLPLRRKKPLSGRAVRSKRAALILLLEFLGDIPLSEIEHVQLVRFMDAVDKLPPNRNKSKQHRDRSIEEILQTPNQKVLHPTTVNKYAGWLGEFFGWLRDNNHIPGNPAFALKRAKDSHPVDEGKPLSIEVIQAVLNGYVYNSEKRRRKDAYNDHRFWIPLLVLYMGFRPNEIAQLRIGGVVMDDIPHISLAKEYAPQVKSDYGRRSIPIHLTLIELGFLNFAKRVQKSGSPRLFMGCRGSESGYAAEIGEWFNESYLKSCGVAKSPRDSQCLYGLRHNFADAVKQNTDTNSVVGDAILGHSSGRLIIDRYGSRIALYIMCVEVMFNVKYDLNLDHLYTLKNNPYADPKNFDLAKKVEWHAREKYYERRNKNREEFDKRYSLGRVQNY